MSAHWTRLLEFECRANLEQHLTAMKVPGKKIKVKMVMTCIERVSCFVLTAISCILCVHFIISLLEVCATNWNALEV